LLPAFRNQHDRPPCGADLDGAHCEKSTILNNSGPRVAKVGLGLLLHAVVHPADIQDRDGGVLLLSTLFGMYPFLAKLFADAGYQGPQFATAVAQILPHLGIEIVKRSDQANGFVVLPMRWVVERTLAWLNRCRRLAKDFENLSRTALAFLQLASIRLMLRKLCNPI
jgi:transposase